MNPFPDSPDRWRSETLRLAEQAAALAEGRQPEMLLWKPEPRAWCTAQCLQHLVLVLRKMLPAWSHALQAAHARERSLWRPTLGDKLMIRMLGPTPLLRLPVPAVYTPDEDLSPPQVLEEFADQHRRLPPLIEDADQRGMLSLRMASPVMRRMRLSMGAWFAGTLVHEQYHLNQAREVLALHERLRR